MVVLGLLLAIAALDLLHQTNFEAFDPCEASCPCDAAEVDQWATTLSVTINVDLSKDGLEHPGTDFPCPTDCPDCHCFSSHVMAKPTEALFVLAHYLAETLDGEKLFSLTHGTYPGIFHPPRIVFG